MLMTIKWAPSNSSAKYKKTSLRVRVENSLIEKYGYTNTDALQENTYSGYVFTWSGGRTFSGDIRCHLADDGSFYNFELGKYSYPNMEESIVRSSQSGFYTYIQEIKDDSSAPLQKMVITFPESVILDKGYWDTVAMISQGVTGTFYFNNGNVFEGKYSAPVQNGGITTISYGEGTYKWYSGDVFKGDFSGRFVGDVPIDGELTLSTGQTPLANWWEVYKLTEDEWKVFKQYPTPTEKFAYAMQVFSIRIINQKIEEINKYIEAGKYKEALKLLDEYEDIASTTTAKDDWIKTKKSILNEGLESIYALLLQGEFVDAVNLRDKTGVNNKTYQGDKKYYGDMGFGVYLNQHHGTGAYQYRLAADGISRIYDGYFNYTDGRLSVSGFFSDGKRDGEWIVIDRSDDNSCAVLLAVYNRGSHDGLLRYARVYKGEIIYYYENEFLNDLFNGTYRTGDDRTDIIGEHRNGTPIGLWKQTFKRNNPLFYRSDITDTHYADFTKSSYSPNLYGFNEGTGQKYDIEVIINEFTYMDHMIFLQFEDNLPGPEHSYNKVTPICVQKL
jgi:hypothetical protein